ncbi:hypothetical protein R6Q59_019972 [Mikania micrantha]
MLKVGGVGEHFFSREYCRPKGDCSSIIEGSLASPIDSSYEFCGHYIDPCCESFGSGVMVVLDTKRKLVGAGARALFYPTMLYNVVTKLIQTEF